MSARPEISEEDLRHSAVNNANKVVITRVGAIEQLVQMLKVLL